MQPLARIRTKIFSLAWPIGIVMLAATLCGCATTEELVVDEDGPPQDPPVAIESTPDAVPKPGPKSKYGNPSSYVVFGKRYYVKASSHGHVERGNASWYGKKFHGRRTSSGEKYNMYHMTAAHRSLPLPTYARVTNLENGRSVVVKINDRGPFHSNRVIDLSYAAARRLKMVEKGTVRVEIVTVDPNEPDDFDSDASESSVRTPVKQAPEPAEPAADRTVKAEPAPKPLPEAKAAPTAKPQAARQDARNYVQVGAFEQRDNAEQLRAQLARHLGKPVEIRTIEGETARHQVRVGPLSEPESAQALTTQLAALGVDAPKVVAD